LEWCAYFDMTLTQKIIVEFLWKAKEGGVHILADATFIILKIKLKYILTLTYLKQILITCSNFN